MKSFEQEIKEYLSHLRYVWDNTESTELLDFSFKFDVGQHIFHLDVKEKRQPYRLTNWNVHMNEPDCFILDDLSVRKCLQLAPYSGVLIRDNITGKYFFFSIIDLALMPRIRKNREIKKNTIAYKGKWIINLRNGKEEKNLADVFYHVNTYIAQLQNSSLFTSLACYGNYVDEHIEQGGITRNPSHWERDYIETR